MDSADLAVFAAVARSGGINKAARALNTVQSNVTQRIRLLEEELGVPLFDRHSRGVTMTTAGAQLLPYAERVGSLLAEARRAATNGPVPSGLLSIGSLETTTALRLPPILAAYATAYPEVDIQLQTGTAASLIADVLEHRVEGAFVPGPVGHADLIETPIVEEELVLVTAPASPSLERLARAKTRDAKIIVFRAGCTYRRMLEELLAAHGITDIRRLELGTLDGIIGCAAAGVGVTLLPRAVVEPARRAGRVAVHEIGPASERVPTMFVRRRDAFVSTALARFIECAQACSAAAARDVPPRRNGVRAAPARSAPASP